MMDITLIKVGLLVLNCNCGSCYFRDAIVDKLDKLVAGGFTSEDVTLIIVAGMIYNHVGNYETALRVLHQGDNLEW